MIPIPTQGPSIVKRPGEYFSNARLIDFKERALANRVKWNASGTRIATLYRGETIIRIRSTTKDRAEFGKTIVELRGHTKLVSDISWSPMNTDILASCSVDGKVIIWQTVFRESLSTLELDARTTFLAFHPTKQHIAVVSGDYGLVILDVGPDNHTLSFSPGKKNDSKLSVDANEIISAIAWSNNGNLIFVGLANGDVCLYSFPDLELVYVLRGHRTAIHAISLDPHGRYLALGSNDSIVSLWDTAQWTSCKIISPSDFPVEHVDFSFDGSLIAISSERDNTLEIYEVETCNKLYKVPNVGTSLVPHFSWHPTKYCIAYTSTATGLQILGWDEDYKGGHRNHRLDNNHPHYRRKI